MAMVKNGKWKCDKRSLFPITEHPDCFAEHASTPRHHRIHVKYLVEGFRRGTIDGKYLTITMPVA